MLSSIYTVQRMTVCITGARLLVMSFKSAHCRKINSNKQDLLLEKRPEYDANVLHAYADSDWASCVKTRRSFGGSCIRLAGGTIAYKSKFQPTVAGSSTEAEFMAAYDTGKMILFVRLLTILK